MRTSLNKVDTSILQTLGYFNQFKYAPTLEELHIFLQTNISLKVLKTSLELLENNKKISKMNSRYTIGEYDKNIDITVQRSKITYKKKEKSKSFVQFISKLRTVQLVGFSGSVSMNSADVPDDIDIFIISSAKRMWITRLFSVGISSLLGLRRKRGQVEAKDTICLNMFMDESDLSIPLEKRTLYIAHEVLQLKPVFDKNDTYKRFLTANSWVFGIFPNAPKYYIQSNKIISNNIEKALLEESIFGNFFELLAKKLQLYFIQKHRTTERISDTQLWFFPNDYEKRLRNKTKK